jgi:hypothetical protein
VSQGNAALRPETAKCVLSTLGRPVRCELKIDLHHLLLYSDACYYAVQHALKPSQADVISDPFVHSARSHR